MSSTIISYHKQQARLKSLKEQQQKAQADAMTPTDVLCTALDEKGVDYYCVGKAVESAGKIAQTVKIDGVNTEVCLCLKTGELLFDGQSAPLKSFFQ